MIDLQPKDVLLESRVLHGVQESLESETEESEDSNEDHYFVETELEEPFEGFVETLKIKEKVC